MCGIFKPLRHPAYGLVVPVALTVVYAITMDARVVPDAGEHGVQSETHEHGNQHSGNDRQTEFVKEFSNDALHETNGQKHSDDGERRGQHRQPDFPRAFHGGVVGSLSHLHMPHNVFAHHDRIINQ